MRNNWKQQAEDWKDRCEWLEFQKIPELEQRLAEAKAEIKILKESELDAVNVAFKLDELRQQLKKYEGTVEVEGRVTTDMFDNAIIGNNLDSKWLEGFIGQPVTVWVKRREG